MSVVSRTFDITVTVGWIKGLEVSDKQVQAVWEAFGLPHQTELQKITPIFDAQAGNVGMVTWNESFGIEGVVVESEEVECYLEIAFWQYADPNEDPVAIGFKRVDISDFHKNQAKVLEFQVDLDQQTHPAQAHIQLSMQEKQDVPPSESAEGAVTAAVEAEPQEATADDNEATALAEQHRQAELEEQRLYELEQQELAKRAEEDRQKKLEQEAAAQLAAQKAAAEAAEAERAARAAEAERAAQEAERAAKAAEAEEAARKAAEAAAARSTEAMAQPPAGFEAVPASTSNEVILLTSAQKAAMFRSLLAHFCGVQVTPADPPHPISRSLAIGDGAVPLGSVVGGIIDEAEGAPGQEAQADLQEKLMHEVLAYYISRLGNGRDLLGALRQEVNLSLKKLLHVPAQLPTFCCPTLDTARLCAFEAAERRATQKAAALHSPGQPVFYFPAQSAVSLPTLPNVLIRAVPASGPGSGSLDEAALNALIAEDIQAGHTPTLLCATVGLDGPSFCDDVIFLQTVCKLHGLVLHLEGPGLFLFMTKYAEAEKLLHLFQDADLALSVALPISQLFCFSGFAVPYGAAMLRYPGAEDFTSKYPVRAADALGLYCKLQTSGLAAISQTSLRKVAEASYLLEALKNCGCVELLTSPSNLYHIRFHFAVPGSDEQDVLKTNEINSMLHQMFLKGLDATTALNALGLHSGQAGVQYFEYNLLSHDISQEVADALVSLFQRCSATLQSIIKTSAQMQAAVQKIETLILMPDISKAPLALACFRLIPPFYRTFERLTESHIKDLNSINNKLIALLQQEDPAFQGVTINGQTFVIVASDAAMTIVFTEEYIDRLVEKLNAIVTKLECDDEILSKIQAEITKRGIEVAEKQILQSKMEEESQESIIRLLPVVGSLANWWSPIEKHHAPESFSFDLRTSTLTKQIPGKLKPTQPDAPPQAKGESH